MGGDREMSNRNVEKEIEAIFRAVYESKTYDEFRDALKKKLTELFFDKIGEKSDN